jgi:hypothetical protein
MTLMIDRKQLAEALYADLSKRLEGLRITEENRETVVREIEESIKRILQQVPHSSVTVEQDPLDPTRVILGFTPLFWPIARGSDD